MFTTLKSRFRATDTAIAVGIGGRHIPAAVQAQAAPRLVTEAVDTAVSTALDASIDQIHDRTSPQFHRRLTAEQLGARCGPASADVQEVVGWLVQAG